MKIDYLNDTTGSKQEAHGSDGRLNVSSRSDERIYYNSRDFGQSYSLSFDDASSDSGDFVCSLFNTDSTGKQMIIHSIEISSDANVKMKLVKVTGTAAGGAVAATPFNLNMEKSNAAAATASTVANSTSSPISGLTADGVIDNMRISANSHEEMKVADTIRVGQNQGIALEADEATTANVSGTIFFYYE
jgi:hypothetical protein